MIPLVLPDRAEYMKNIAIYKKNRVILTNGCGFFVFIFDRSDDQIESPCKKIQGLSI